MDAVFGERTGNYEHIPPPRTLHALGPELEEEVRREQAREIGSQNTPRKLKREFEKRTFTFIKNKCIKPEISSSCNS